MENDVAIQVEGISKLYRLGTTNLERDNLVSTIAAYLRSPLKNYRKYRSLYDFRDIDPLTASPEQLKAASALLALRDISFTVKHGEALGIVGLNGAGKSTLLKILAKITPPTAGRAKIKGRVGSLLEVGTGFHQELTGRENVYLNGTILGMRKQEVDRRFDEIVEFSGVEEFLDTPVKRYSSGMRVRLAFAVAAHLEPEILIVDEVLAVGDVTFQKKCLNKMRDVGSEGRTVLFVSHNMPSVTRLCDRALLLDHGSLIKDGPVQEVIATYLHEGSGCRAERKWIDVAAAPGNDKIRLIAVRVIDEAGNVSEAIDIRRPLRIEMEYEITRGGMKLMPFIGFQNDAGIRVFWTNDLDPEWRGRRRPAGHYVSSVTVPGNYLGEGTLFISAGMNSLEPAVNQFFQGDVVAFQVIDTLDGDTARGDWGGKMSGVVRPALDWHTDYRPAKNQASLSIVKGGGATSNC